nr:MAG: hypothetical protein [Bacteriophage sp.]
MSKDIQYVLVLPGKFIGTRDDYSGAFASPKEEQRFRSVIEANSKAAAVAATSNVTGTTQEV